MGTTDYGQEERQSTLWNRWCPLFLDISIPPDLEQGLCLPVTQFKTKEMLWTEWWGSRNKRKVMLWGWRSFKDLTHGLSKAWAHSALSQQAPIMGYEIMQRLCIFHTCTGSARQNMSQHKVGAHQGGMQHIKHGSFFVKKSRLLSKGDQ